jgi:hypothetical protein
MVHESTAGVMRTPEEHRRCTSESGQRMIVRSSAEGAELRQPVERLAEQSQQPKQRLGANSSRSSKSPASDQAGSMRRTHKATEGVRGGLRGPGPHGQKMNSVEQYQKRVDGHSNPERCGCAFVKDDPEMI